MSVIIHFAENHTVIYADGNSSSFTIPSEFIDSPIQLIWSTDGVTQCVCPLVEELIPRCACNRNSTLSLSSNTITISRSEDVHSLVIYLANTSCCNVRSIIGIYRVIFDQGSYWPGGQVQYFKRGGNKREGKICLGWPWHQMTV